MTGSQTVGRLDAPRTIRIDSDSIPSAGRDDVVIKVACSGICGSDLAMYREGAPVDGAVLGHEFCGTVVEAGLGVEGVAAGDRVVANPMIDLLGLGRLPGSFSEYLRLPAATAGANLFVIPDTIPDEVGAMIEPFAVGIHAVNRSRVRPGERIAIYGAGPIGLCVLACLKARGVDDVLAIDPSAARRDMAIRMGAKATHDPLNGSSSGFVATHFGSEASPVTPHPVALADVVFDCAGVPASMEQAVHSLATRGRLVLVADPHETALTGLRLVMLRELEVLGALAYEDEFAEAIDLLATGKVDLAPLVSHRFALADLGDAFETQMDAERAIKVIVRP
ncbi:MAG: zinc-binding dehydrogenase [Novosphingobium sp.]|nr:zinc-binding dehydrogenase [Novosphingobium sp.]